MLCACFSNCWDQNPHTSISFAVLARLSSAARSFSRCVCAPCFLKPSPGDSWWCNRGSSRHASPRLGDFLHHVRDDVFGVWSSQALHDCFINVTCFLCSPWLRRKKREKKTSAILVRAVTKPIADAILQCCTHQRSDEREDATITKDGASLCQVFCFCRTDKWVVYDNFRTTMHFSGQGWAICRWDDDDDHKKSNFCELKAQEAAAAV